MGIALPQVVTSDRASGAQVIDGSLKFDGSSKNRLDRTPSTIGNQKTWTWSGWIKRNKLADEQVVFTAGASTGGTYWAALRLNTDDSLQFINNSSNSTDINVNTTQRFRDVSSWYHILLRVDIANTTTNDRIDLYINGVKVDDFSTQTQPGTGVNTGINYNHIHAIGGEPARNLYYDTLQMSQVYLIDGQALGPENFGYTDPLTNTWRPKKYEGVFSGDAVAAINYSDNGQMSSSATFNGAPNDAAASFDGSLDGPNVPYLGGSSAEIVWTPTGTLSYSSKIEIYVGGVSSFRYNLNNGGWNTTTINSWNTVSTGSGTITTIKVDRNGDSTHGWHAIRIDGTILINSSAQPAGVNGFYLPMDGNSPIGEDKSGTVTPNDGTTWSSGISGTSGGSAVTVTTPGNAFDGSVSTKATFTHSAGQDSILTWTVPGGGISGSTFRIYCYQPQGTSGANQYLSINGGTYVVDTSWNGVSANADGWSASQTIPGGTLTSIALKLSYGGASSQYLYAVEVDGVILIDNMYGNSWTPVNFGGSVALDNPQVSGARPILNTDGGGRTARVGVFGSEESKYYTVTTANGSVYQFDITSGDNPSISFIRGATYKFDYSSHTGHPLLFSSTNPDSSTTAYTDGTSIANNVISFTVPHNAPDTLYYYCSNHPTSMNGSIGVTTDETKADPYAWKNVLALPLVGVKDDVSTQISPVELNDVTRIRFKTDWNWMYVSAIEINGTILTTGTLDNSGSVWSGGDNWKNGSVGSGQETYSQAARGDWFDVTLASTLNIDNLRIYVYLDASAGSTTNIFELELFFSDGTSFLKALPSNSFAPNGNFNQRSWQDFGSVTFKSVLSTNAVANYTFSNFYGGSWYFDGTGDYLSVSSSSDLTFGTGDFTLEYFINTTDTNFNLMHPDSSTGSGYWGHLIQSSSFNWNNAYNSTNLWNVNATPILNGGWHHCAICRASGTTKVFFDGISQPNTAGTFTDNTDYSGVDGWEIGGSGNLGDLTGYIQDLRVYKGVAKYTSDFVVPSTSPDILPDTPSGVSGGSKLAKVNDGAVSFDGTDDFLKISGSSDFDFGTSDFTVECFVYFNNLSSNQGVLDTRSGSNTNGFALLGRSNGTVSMADGTSLIGDAISVSSSRWMHLAASRSGSSLKFFVDGVLSSTVTNSTDFSNDDFIIGTIGGGTEDLNGFTSNVRVIKGTALYTTDFTPPTRELTNVTNTKLLCCQSPSNVKLSPVAPTVGTTANTRFNSNFETIPTTVNSLTVTNNGSVSTTSAGTNSFGFTNAADFTGGNSLSVNLGAIPQVTTIDIIFKVTGTTNNKYLFAISNTGLVRRTGSSLDWYNNNADQTISTTPDDGNWHHLRVTPSRLYFDGTEIVNTSTTPNIFVSSNGYMALGAYRNDSGTIQYNGGVDIALVRVMPGVDLGPPSSIPITTNGTLSSTETIPSDGVIFAAGDAAATNFNPFTTDINAVRGQETGYATLNPLSLTKTLTLSNGNLDYTATSAENNECFSNIRLNGGKFYFESNLINAADVPGSTSFRFGICKNLDGVSGSNIIIYNATGNFETFGTTDSSPPQYTAGNIIGVAVDCVNGSIQFFKDGISVGTKTFSIVETDEWTSYIRVYKGGGNTVNGTINFGQKPFKFPPPVGFQPLNAANVRPETVIARPDQYVGVTTYTGDGSTQSITMDNSALSPDFVWIKCRNDGIEHQLFDSVRGALKSLRSDDNSVENTVANSLTSFDSNGFSLGSSQNVNHTKNYVAWCWKAGGNKNTFNVDDVGYASAAAAGLTGGSTAPNGASVGTKQGFSIIKWTGTGSGTSLGHGLGSAPDFVIVKSLANTREWLVWHSSFNTASNTDYLYLNTTGSKGGSGAGDYWNNSAPTSTTFSVGNSAAVNSGGDFIAYLWHDVPGLQKFGSYTGNGTADYGTFVELGFRPAIIIIKRTTSGSGGFNWTINDSERGKYNPNGTALFPNLSNIESTNDEYEIDFLSNGFKLRCTTPDSTNVSAQTYIYAAWAEAPEFNLYGAQSNAR